MGVFDQIKEYSAVVCSQVRWKKVHTAIAEELECHMIDQRDTYMAEGKGEAEATKLAVLQMGDPVEVGMELDRTHRPKPQWSMILLTMTLTVFGFFLKVIIPDEAHSYYFDAGKLIVMLCVGIGAFSAAYCMDFSFLGRRPRTLFYILLLSVLPVTLMSTKVAGKIFVALPVFWPVGSSLISMECISLIYPLGFALFIYSMRNKGYFGMVLCGLAYVVMMSILSVIPSMSGMLLSVSAIVLMGLSILKGWFGVERRQGFLLIGGASLVAVAGAACYLWRNPYYIRRIAAAFWPFRSPSEGGYLSVTTIRLLQNSVFVGQGTLPAGYGTDGFPLPSVTIDYIVTYLIFHYGWITFIGIAGLFALFIGMAVVRCVRQKSVLGTLVSLSVILSFGWQTMLYLMMNLGFRPVSPISLPFVSYGNTALILNMVLVGFMLSAFRNGDGVRERRTGQPEGRRHILWQDRKLTIDFKR